MTKYLPRMLFASGLIVGTVLLLWEAASLRTISHDDGISYIAATGHQGRYAIALPSNRWTTAADFQAFWEPERFWFFRQIGHDLAAWDIHPPLYFWVLHVWCHVCGVALSTGPLLNVPILIAASVMIFLACRLLGLQVWCCSTASVVWLLAPATLATAVETRQYCLLALMSAAFLVSLIAFREKQSVGRACWVGAIACAGMLTHFQFALLIVGGIGVTSIALIRDRSLGPLAMLYLALLLGAAAFVLIHPEFHLSIARQQAQAQHFTWAGVPSRVHNIVYALLTVFAPVRYSPSSLFEKGYVMALGLIAAVFSAHAIGSTLKQVSFADCFRVDSLPLACGILGLLGICGLYLAAASPLHAMNHKYLAMVLPPFFVVLGQWMYGLSRKMPRGALVIAVTVLVHQAVCGTLSAARFVRFQEVRGDIALSVPSAAMILDSTARGVLPRLLWHADPASPVYAAMQTDLLKRFPELPPNGTLLYLSNLEYGNSLAGRAAVVHEIGKQGYRAFPRTTNVFDFVEVFEFKKTGSNGR